MNVFLIKNAQKTINPRGQRGDLDIIYKMPFLYLALSLLFIFFLSACGANERQADLKITYLKDGIKSQEDFSCRGSSCQVINGIDWAPVLPGTICKEGYGGTDLVFIRGTVNGEEVNSRFQKTSACEISRFASIENLLRFSSLKDPAKDEGPSTVSSWLKLTDLSHTLARILPFAPILWVTSGLLIVLTAFFSLWFFFLQRLATNRSWNLFAFSVLLPPLTLFLQKKANDGRAFSFRFVLDGAILVGSLFLPWQATVLFLGVLLYLIVQPVLKENKDPEVNKESEE